MQKSLIVKIGDFFFKYRNALFPILLISLFVLRLPADEYAGKEKYEVYKDIVSVFIVAFGLLLRASVIGFAYIKRGGRNKQVYADKLVIEGFFNICRNPLYVGNLIIYFGILLMHGDPLVIAIGSAFFLFVYHAIVSAEEFFLKNKFGDEFTEYCRRVPRWLPMLGRLKESTKGMKFNYKRVLLKDYTTISNALIAMIGLEFYEEIYFDPMSTLEVVTFIGLLALCVVFVLVVKKAKKSGFLTAGN